MIDGLHDEIKQAAPFPRRTTEAMLEIMRTAALLDHELNEVLRPFGLTPTQYNVLRILRGAGQGGLCGRDIAQRLVSTVPDVPRLLDRMETMLLIRRERSEHDRRYVTARLATRGRELLEEVTPRLDEVERARMGSLDDEVLEGLIEGLAEIRRCP